MRADDIRGRATMKDDKILAKQRADVVNMACFKEMRSELNNNI